jgi:broad specificity phosphatase PhoE
MGCRVARGSAKLAPMLRYLTHPEVSIAPAVPVPKWSLSERGRRRALAMLEQPWLIEVGRIISSDETKAIETAEIVASHLRLPVEIREGIGENDRSSVGFVPPAEFEVLANAFFAEPEQSIRGWERAIDAQRRIADGLADLLVPAERDVLVVGHGGVGTLWFCFLNELAIDRRHDQPGQGHYFSVDQQTRRAEHGWRRIDAL